VAVARAMRPAWVIGVGGFARKRAELALAAAGIGEVRIGTILYPSLASPAANRDWAGKATRQLEELGIW